MSVKQPVRSAGIWATGMVAALAACTVGVLVLHSHDAPGPVAAEKSSAGNVSAKEPGSEPGAKSPRAKAEEAEFPDPSVIARRFTTELTRLFKQNKVVAPSELFRQAQQAKRCDVVPLPEPGERLPPEAIYARARPAVVVIGSVMRPSGHRGFHAALASGFVIRGDGVLVTNYHVLEAFQHARAVAAMTHDERVLPIQKVLAADEHNDVAVVKVDAENLAALPIAASAPVGATVYCLSHPALDTGESETAFFTFTQGIVCGKFHLRLNGPKPLNVLAITADYAKGSSGGPILNDRGAVVGIICQTRALFHDQDETEPQITWKFSRPSSSLLALLQPAAGPP